MSERVRFLLFYENGKTMTSPLFPYCCGNNKRELPLLESCCARKEANISDIMSCKKIYSPKDFLIF